MATIVKIDFTGSTSPPSGWNSISGPTTTGVRIADLLDTTGAATGISIEQVLGFDGSVAPSLAAGDHHTWPNSVWSEAWHENELVSTHYFTLSGLTSGATITLLVAGFRGENRDGTWNLRDSAADILDSGVYDDPSTTTPTVQLTLTATVPADGILRLYLRSTNFFAYVTGIEFEVESVGVAAAITRHTPHALPGQPWGTFSGKMATEAPRVVGIITQLMPYALPGRPYGNFGGKQLSDEPIDDIIYNRGFMANMNRSMIPR